MPRSYQERIDARMAEGFSRSQARGHPQEFEPSISHARATFRDILSGELADLDAADPLVREWARELMADDPDAAWDLIQAMTDDPAERHDLYSDLSGSP